MEIQVAAFVYLVVADAFAIRTLAHAGYFAWLLCWFRHLSNSVVLVSRSSSQALVNNNPVSIEGGSNGLREIVLISAARRSPKFTSEPIETNPMLVDQFDNSRPPA